MTFPRVLSISAIIWWTSNCSIHGSVLKPIRLNARRSIRNAYGILKRSHVVCLFSSYLFFALTPQKLFPPKRMISPKNWLTHPPTSWTIPLPFFVLVYALGYCTPLQLMSYVATCAALLWRSTKFRCSRRNHCRCFGITTSFSPRPSPCIWRILFDIIEKGLDLQLRKGI